MIRVVIADDHAIVREGLKRIIAEFDGVQVVGETDNGGDVIDACQRESPDVLLLDVSMPGRPFLDTLDVLRTQLPALRILVLSMYPENQYAVRALKAGAAGYLTKGHDPETLRQAIRRVHGGGRYITPALAESLAHQLGPEPPAVLHELLSDREFEVLVLLGQGKRNTEIGDHLALSPKTVGTYRARIFEKMDFSNIADLVRYAADNHLLQ